MVECTNVGVGQALSLWWMPTKLDGYCIDGLSTIWIGRIAKLLVLISSIPLIIDLLGEKRIHEMLLRRSDVLGRGRIGVIDTVSSWLNLMTENFERNDPGGFWGSLDYRRLSNWIDLLWFLGPFYAIMAWLMLDGTASSVLDAIIKAGILLIGGIVIVLIGFALLPIAGFLVVKNLEISVVVLRNEKLCFYVRGVALVIFAFAFLLDFFGTS